MAASGKQLQRLQTTLPVSVRPKNAMCIVVAVIFFCKMDRTISDLFKALKERPEAAYKHFIFLCVFFISVPLLHSVNLDHVISKPIMRKKRKKKAQKKTETSIVHKQTTHTLSQHNFLHNGLEKLGKRFVKKVRSLFVPVVQTTHHTSSSSKLCHMLLHSQTSLVVN